MDDIVYVVTVGAMLHDFGKILYRSNIDGRSHSISGADYIKKYTDNQNIIDCIRFHHRKEINQTRLERSDPAYIVYIADNISSGADRRDIEGESKAGFDKNRMLESIYNILNNRSGKACYLPGEIKRTVNYPENIQPRNLASEYGKIVTGFSNGLSGIYFEPQYINSLIELCEAYMSYIPSSTLLGQVSDISLFDHSKITAALAACIALYLKSNGIEDYYQRLFENEKDFYNEKAFCLFSVDISGIQQFIYNISSKGALKGLRSRSFYLEILLENIADEVLEVCSLSRSNILYTGGGHAYALLPNTNEAKHSAEEAMKKINLQLMEEFGTRIFAAFGMEICSANELMSKTDDPESYVNIFRSVASKISAMKLRRYSARDIRYLNSGDTDRDGRECAICGAVGDLNEHDGIIMCDNCYSFADISGELINPNSIFAVTCSRSNGSYLPIFSADGSDLYLNAMTADEAKQMLKNDPENVVRIYSKNEYRTGLSLAEKLWMGDYAAKSSDGQLKTFAQLAESSDGIGRIGVLRADVDNLGMAFTNGFVRSNDFNNKYRYITISRTATFSRSLSLFFKYNINYLMKNPEFSLTDKKGSRDVVIVYSGGDDLFIVGAWDDVLCAAVDIHDSFMHYTDGALTLSAGFSVFKEKYPISLMAKEAAQLEDKAKHHVYQGGVKNSISLFGLEAERGHLTDKHTYDWDTFEHKVLGEKYARIRKLFTAGGDYGNSFLYNILYLLRQSEGEKINIARLAYLLARHEPAKQTGDELKSAYSDFSTHIYKWALDEEDRRQLISALILYIYTMREKPLPE